MVCTNARVVRGTCLLPWKRSTDLTSVYALRNCPELASCTKRVGSLQNLRPKLEVRVWMMMVHNVCAFIALMEWHSLWINMKVAGFADSCPVKQYGNCNWIPSNGPGDNTLSAWWCPMFDELLYAIPISYSWQWLPCTVGYKSCKQYRNRVPIWYICTYTIMVKPFSASSHIP